MVEGGGAEWSEGGQWVEAGKARREDGRATATACDGQEESVECIGDGEERREGGGWWVARMMAVPVVVVVVVLARASQGEPGPGGRQVLTSAGVVSFAAPEAVLTKAL
jgi:hypothetical protein